MAALQLIQKHVAPEEPFDVRRFQMLRDFNVQITGPRWHKLQRIAAIKHAHKPMQTV